MSDHEPVIEVRNLIKSYEGSATRALDGIDLSIGKGEIFGLIGPNGAGKTTLIGCLLGLLKPEQGKISIFGKPADSMSVRMITGYVPERSDFEHWMTARQFLQYHHGLARRDPARETTEIEEALSTVELDRAVWDRRLKTYSRGMLQRLNLAQLLVGKPRLALLDEPTLGLDPTGVSVMRSIVAKMREENVTAIINSHQLDEVERLCDRVAYIRKGKIGSIEKIKEGAIADYWLFIKWSGTTLNGTLAAAVSEAINLSGAKVEEFNHEWGRFCVKDSSAAAHLIKQLIEQGLPVEEAIPDRMRLEQLFARDREASA